MHAPQVEDKVDIVCRDHDEYWYAVYADLFGWQTAMKIGKGSDKGMTLSAEFVSGWIDHFSIAVHVSDRVDYIYTAFTPGQYAKKQHNEEKRHRRVLDTYDRDLIDTEVEK